MKAIDRDFARASLRRFVECLNAGFRDRFFVIDGTLLGLVRSGDFIQGDTDIDFGMRIEDYDERLIGDLTAAGFALADTFGTREDGLGLHFLDGDLVFDILFFYADPPDVWTAVYDVGEQMCGTHRAFDLESRVFQGIDVLVPSPPERYLETAYGRKWRQPVRLWDYRFAPRNLRAHGGFAWRLKYAVKKALWRLIHHDMYLKPGEVRHGPLGPSGSDTRAAPGE